MSSDSELYLSLVFRKLHVNLRDNSTTTTNSSGQQQRYGRRLLRSNIGQSQPGPPRRGVIENPRSEQRDGDAEETGVTGQEGRKLGIYSETL